MAAPHTPRHTRGHPGHGPAAMGAGVLAVILGVSAAALAGLGTGAYWLIALAATLIAALGYAIPTIREAPRLSDATDSTAERNQERQTAQTAGPAAKDLALGLATTDSPSPELSPATVVVITGHTTSGKTPIAERLTQEHPDWGWASCGRYVKDQARRRGLGQAHATTNTLGQRLVEELGGDRFLDEVIEHARLTNPPEVLVIDDVYHEQVYDAVTRRFPHLKFVAINLPPSVREHLTAGAERDADPLNIAFAELTRRHQPHVSLDGAADTQQVLARTRELEQKLALVA